MNKITKPKEGEYNPFTLTYMKLVEEMEVSGLLTLFADMKSFLQSIPEEKLNYRYAEGKWTVKEALVHMIDTERIFAYRALRIARNDKTDLPGFEQDYFVSYSSSGHRTLADILEEFELVRRSSVALFNSFDAAAWQRVGSVGHHPTAVATTFYVIAGHALHHINILKEKYLL